MKQAPADQLDLVIYNAHTQPFARLADYLEEQLADGRFDVAVLNEVTEHADVLGRWGRAHGYTVHQERARPRLVAGMVTEEGSTALLINDKRPDLQRVPSAASVAAMTCVWRVFSHQQAHWPRRFQRDKIKTAGGRWKLQGDHWPTNGRDGGNRAAWAESASRTGRWLLARLPGTIAVAPGDKNEHHAILAAVMRRYGGRVYGHNVDHAIVAGPVNDVQVDVLGKGESDHHGVRLLITRRPGFLKRLTRAA